MFWVCAAMSYFIFPGHLVLMTQAMITGLFVVSLDIMFGYAGIPSFGHAAFFGIGAYTAGILARDWWGDPLLGLVAGALVAGLAGAICSQLVARLHGIAMLMVTLGIGLICYEIANKWNSLDRRRRRPARHAGARRSSASSPSISTAGSALSIPSSSSLLLYLLARRLVNSPFGLALNRHSRKCSPRAGARHRRARAVGDGLHHFRGDGWRCWRAAGGNDAVHRA